MHRSITPALTLTLTLACTSVPAADDEAGTTTSPSSTDADESTSGESTSITSDDDPTLGTSSSSSDDIDSGPFLPRVDGGLPPECDSFAQDCPEGEKCVPYASSGDIWDALKCVPVFGDQAPGDPCKYAGLVESTDDCNATSFCWNADENGEGTCHPFCMGTPDMPECPPMSQCTISGSGVINLCIPTCDPTIQNCPEGTACFWANSDFNCIFTTQDIPTGDPCGYINDCALGNMCVDAAALPSCDGSACCANFCDLELDDTQCAATPGTACVPFFEQGMAPRGYEHIGICILPG